jgi:hypothetical protein
MLGADIDFDSIYRAYGGGGQPLTSAPNTSPYSSTPAAWVNELYNKYLGRDVESEDALNYWYKMGPSYAEAGIKNSPEALGIGSGGEGGGGGEMNMDWPTDLYPKSSSKSVNNAGLPEWANKWVQDYLGQYAPQLTGGLSKSLSDLENPIALNEAEKSNLQYFANENLRPVISNLGTRGVLNSSTSQNAIAKVLADMGGTSYQTAMTNQQNKINDYLKGMALLESLLGASRYSSGTSTSESSNQWAPYGDMMNYIANMSLMG